MFLIRNIFFNVICLSNSVGKHIIIEPQLCVSFSIRHSKVVESENSCVWLYGINIKRENCNFRNTFANLQHAKETEM